MSNNIGSLFDKRFGAPSGGLGTFGGLPGGEALSGLEKKLKADELAKKDAAMKIAQERLREKRLAMRQQQFHEPPAQKIVRSPVMQVETFSSARSEVQTTHISDPKDEAMLLAIEWLREKRASLPPIPREMRTR